MRRRLKSNRQYLFVFTGCCVVGPDAVHFIGLGDVQLVACGDLLEVGALVECAAETGLPHGGVVLVPPLPVFALVHGPGLDGKVELTTSATG